jgi:hypothetical protein
MSTDNDLSPDEIRMLENGSAETWDRLTDKQKAEWASWGLGGAPSATDSESATTGSSAASKDTEAMLAATEIADAAIRPKQREAAEALLQPPARPFDYRLPDAPPGIDRLPPEDDKMLREFFHANAFDQSEATWAVNEAYRVGKQMQELARGDPSTLDRRIDDAILLAGAQGTAELSRTWGPRYESKMALAREEASRLAEGRPEIAHALFETPLGNSVAVVRLLAERAQRRISS